MNYLADLICDNFLIQDMFYVHGVSTCTYREVLICKVIGQRKLIGPYKAVTVHYKVDKVDFLSTSKSINIVHH